ncbi:helix-turn-helix transcriptional regulator [Dyella telluris]|uniref:Addiction module antidote protein, HigA family n=1 Tax=Dyella telluris TaxID=2763498 RepID=A0A7G8PZC0_9GAMM|nr:hypothetical protein [Dyella telluris]QNJ99877.1 hypothetical protein H8F01_12075 [Dyella telluris]
MLPTAPILLVPLHPRMEIDAAVPARSPSAVLRDDYMLPHAISAADLALRTGIPAWHIRRMLIGSPFYPEESHRLAAVLGTSALYWLVLQARFELERVLREAAPGELDVH